MQAVTGQLDWSVLGVEPVPGDVGSISAIAHTLQALAARAGAVQQQFSGHAGAVADASWRGATASAYRSAIGVLDGAMGAMADRVAESARAVTAFAGAVADLHAHAVELHHRATEAATRAEQAQLLVQQHTRQLSVQEAAARQLQADWAAAQARADLAVAGPTGAVEQAHADTLRQQASDAGRRLSLIRVDLADALDEQEAATATLEEARVDARRLAELFEAEASTTAAALTPPAPGGLDVIGPAPAPPEGGPITASPALPAAIAGAPAASTSRPTGPRPAPVPPAGASSGTGRGRGATRASTAASGQPLVSAATTRKTLLQVLRTGQLVAVGKVTPSSEEFQRYRDRGLQAVAARGAAVARALGFEGEIGGLGWRPTRSDHGVGLALDLMTYDDAATGEALAAFYRTHHQELGVTYVIWDGHISSHVDDWAWRPYHHPAGRTDPTAMHVDHVHISFDDEANGYALASFGLSG